jgi:hypothetical protein
MALLTRQAAIGIVPSRRLVLVLVDERRLAGKALDERASLIDHFRGAVGECRLRISLSSSARRFAS